MSRCFQYCTERQAVVLQHAVTPAVVGAANVVDEVFVLVLLVVGGVVGVVVVGVVVVVPVEIRWHCCWHTCSDTAAVHRSQHPSSPTHPVLCLLVLILLVHLECILLHH